MNHHTGLDGADAASLRHAALRLCAQAIDHGNVDDLGAGILEPVAVRWPDLHPARTHGPRPSPPSSGFAATQRLWLWRERENRHARDRPLGPTNGQAPGQAHRSWDSQPGPQVNCLADGPGEAWLDSPSWTPCACTRIHTGGSESRRSTTSNLPTLPRLCSALPRSHPHCWSARGEWALRVFTRVASAWTCMQSI